MNSIQNKIDQYEYIIDTLNLLIKELDDSEFIQEVMMLIENVEDDFKEDYAEWQDILMTAENEEKKQMESEYWADQF